MSKHPTTLPLPLPPIAQSVVETLRNNKYECYVVGGYIRDLLCGRKTSTSGIDFATNAPPEKICHFFPDSTYTNTYGTVIVSIANTYAEITTYRSESSYQNHRHPEKVTWGSSIHQDILRRDFTINALAYDGHELIDDVGGIEDIRAKIIRTVGKAHDRFAEDSLRMLRAVRFSSQLGFSIDPDTLHALSAQNQLLAHISSERIRDEFLKLLSSDHAADGILILKNTGLMEYVLPELLPSFDCEQKSPERHHIYDAGTHMVKSLEALKNPDPIVRLATLIHDIGKPQTRSVTSSGIVTFYNHEIVGTDIAYNIAKRLKLSKKDTIRLTKLIRYHQFTVDEKQTDNAIRRLIRNVGQELIDDLIDIRFADRIGSGSNKDSWRFQKYRERVLEVQKQPFSVSDLALDGNDIMRECSLKPGPKVGKILNELFRKVSEEGLPNNKDSLLNALSTLT